MLTNKHVELCLLNLFTNRNVPRCLLYFCVFTNDFLGKSDGMNDRKSLREAALCQEIVTVQTQLDIFTFLFVFWIKQTRHNMLIRDVKGI